MASAQSSDEMDPDDLTRTDKSILDVLKRGQGAEEPWGMATKGMLVDETGFSRNSVYNSLRSLREAGHIELVHDPTRLFKYVSDPREEEINEEIADGGDDRLPLDCSCGAVLETWEELRTHLNECDDLGSH